MRKIKEIIIHCADTYADMNIGVKEIDHWHKARGWDMVGYHYVIKRSGAIEVGRPVEKIGAHCRGRNRYSIGVCLAGGKPDFNYTYFQMKSLNHIVESLLEAYPGADVIGHRDAPGVTKSCPGFDVKSWFRGKFTT